MLDFFLLVNPFSLIASGHLCLIVRNISYFQSPLSLCAHEHPIHSLATVGTAEGHNIVSIASDGTTCVWNMVSDYVV